MKAEALTQHFWYFGLSVGYTRGHLSRMRGREVRLAALFVFFFFSGVYKPTFVPLAGSVPTPVLGYSARVFVAGFVVHTFMIRGVSVVRNIFDLGMHDVRILLPDAA